MAQPKGRGLWKGEWCKRCDRRNVVGFEVPSDVWDSVVGDFGTVWCLACFDEEAERLGIKYEAKPVQPLAWHDWEDPADIDYGQIDSGIVGRVRMLRKAGYETTDSGDGSVEKQAMGCAMPFPHVVCVVPKQWMAEHAAGILKACQYAGDPPSRVQLMYSPVDEVPTVLVIWES